MCRRAIVVYGQYLPIPGSCSHLRNKLCCLNSLSLRGGFSLEAAAKIAGATPLPTSPRLKEKSLLRQVGSQRYDMHELLRQFATEQLEVMGPNWTDQGKIVRARHSVFYLEFVASQKSELYGQEPQSASAAIRVELDNIRQAWRWAVESTNPVALEQSAGYFSAVLHARWID